MMLVMALLSTVIYWIGLPNLIITEDKITIIHTKTSGYELVNHSNKLKWDSRKLLPNNYEVLYFSRSYQSFPLDIQIELPKLHPIPPDIIETNINKESIPKININGDLSFRIDDQHIINLLESRKLLPNQLDLFYQEQLQIIKDLLTKEILESSIREIESYISKENILSILNKNLYYMDIEHIHITNVTLVNLEIYQNLNDDISPSILKNEEEIFHNAKYIQISEKEQSLIEFKLELEKLESLGALLTKYPILLAYMALSNEYPLDNPISSLFIKKYLSINNLMQKDFQENINQ